MTEALLFLHVLAAFALATGVVLYSAFALGAPARRGMRRGAEGSWLVGLVGTLVFGIWLAFDFGAYSITDGWILAALGLWLVAGAFGERARDAVAPAGGNGTADAAATAEWGGPSPAAWHWMRVAVVVVLLADMVWKPGA